MATLLETEWFLETTTRPALLQTAAYTYRGPTSVAVHHPHKDALHRAVQQHMKVTQFLQAFQKPQTAGLRLPEYSEERTKLAPCPYMFPASACDRLLAIPFPEEFAEGVFEALQLPLEVLTRIKGAARVCILSVNSGEFHVRQERTTSHDARLAAHFEALAWAVPELLRAWRQRHCSS